MNKIYFFFISLFTVNYCLADTYPDTSKIPAKWKQESIILLDYYHKYELAVNGKNSEVIHLTYYIRDKWGLDELSVLNLPSDIEGTFNDSTIGTIYKHNGKIIPIRKDHLIPRKTTIDFSNSKSRSSKGFSLETSGAQKLAVPSLEVGDILDINFTNTGITKPNVIPLINKFPVLHFNVKVNLSSYAYSSLNYTGNYSLFCKEMNSEVPYESSSNSISVSIDSLDKYKEEILNDNNKQIPYLLIGYTYSNNSSEYEKNYKSMESKYASDLQIQMVRNLYQSGKDQKSVAHQILNGLNKKYSKITDTVAFVNDAYYLYREVIAKKDLFNGLKGSNYKDDKFFACVMTRVLFSKKIKHKVFITQPDYYGSVKKPNDFIDIYYGVCVPSKNLYLFNPLYAYDPGVIPSYFENQDLITFSANKHYKKYHYIWYFWLYPPAGLATLPITLPIYLVKKTQATKYRKFDFAEGKFPTSKAETNGISHELTINKIDYANTSLVCEQKSSYLGKIKLIETNKICDASYIYENADNPYSKLLYAIPPKFKTDTADEKKLKKYLNQVIKSNLYDEGFNVEKLNSFQINETNFFDNTKPFVHTSNFTASELIWNYNDYVILKAGKLIGSQLIVPEKSKDRQQNFYIPYPQQFSWKITIPIPDGYAVQNLNDFNIKKNTSAGEFISEATIKGSNIIINVKKSYLFSFFPFEDASDVYDFLNEAERYYNKKMIFKKKA